MKLSDAFGRHFMLPPPIPGKFRALDRARASLVLARLLETSFPSDGLEAEAVRILPLNFYPGWLLLDIQARPTEAAEGPFQYPGLHSLLYGPDGFTPLDGTSRQVHEHNARHGIKLYTPEVREAYLRFFCAFIRGKEGPFEVIDDDMGFHPASDWEEAPDPAPVMPPERMQPDKKDVLERFRACLYYGDRFFAAKFDLFESGNISMVDDAPISGKMVRSPALMYQNTLRFPKPNTSWE